MIRGFESHPFFIKKVMFLEKNKRFRKGRLFGLTSSVKAGSLVNGTFGIKVLENGYLTVDQLEAARKSIKAVVKRCRFVTPVNLRVTPLLSRSKKKKGIRMGGSKGGFFNFVYRARAGVILVEIRSVLNYQLFCKLRQIAFKFPVKTALVFKKT